MWEKFKQTWRRLKAANPGQRFQQEFRRRHGAGRSPIQKALLIVGGLLLMAAGFLLLFIPGPGSPLSLRRRIPDRATVVGRGSGA
jgi:hypothetical protein